MDRRQLIITGSATALLAATGAWAATKAVTPEIEVDDAPFLLIPYLQRGCPLCEAFDRDHIPGIRKAAIDGRIHFRFLLQEQYLPAGSFKPLGLSFEPLRPMECEPTILATTRDAPEFRAFAEKIFPLTTHRRPVWTGESDWKG